MMENVLKMKRSVVGVIGLTPWRVAVLAVFACLASAERLIWEEEFNTFDLNVWNHLVTASRGFNNEFQYYRNNRKNSYVKDGILYLKPTFTAEDFGLSFLYDGYLTDAQCNLKPCESVAGNDIVLPIMSARIRTIGSFSFLYGRVEVRAKLPRGDWIWPAIWMKSVDNSYGGWPASGEIDIMEARCNKNYTNRNGVSDGIDTVGSTLHFGPNSSYNVWRPTHWKHRLSGGEDFSSDFHIYGLEWKEESITFTVDGQKIGSVTPPAGGFWELGNFSITPGGENIWRNGTKLAPFDKKFYIILNVAVGGRFFADGLRNSPYPRPWNWRSPHPMRDFWEKRSLWLPTWNLGDPAMKVDYIRVYSW